jgi:hypothetical protein
MKTRVILTLCVVFVLGFASHASAQVTLVAGSAEDKAFTACSSEQNIDNKITRCLEFEKQFPNSKALGEAYVSLLEAYGQKNDKPKIDEIGEKALKLDPENITALMLVSRNYGMEKKNLERAVTHAQTAVTVLAKRKGEPRYQEDAAWKQYLDSTEQAAKANLQWIKSLKP